MMIEGTSRKPVDPYWRETLPPLAESQSIVPQQNVFAGTKPEVSGNGNNAEIWAALKVISNEMIILKSHVANLTMKLEGSEKFNASKIVEIKEESVDEDAKEQVSKKARKDKASKKTTPTKI